MELKKRHSLILIPLIFVFALAIYLFNRSLGEASFLGLETVPCIDPTKPITENYTLNIAISINGESYPLTDNIGHDYGNCLRAIHTDNGSGEVYVETNDGNTYTLQNFFQVWKKNFTSDRLENYVAGGNHTLQVFLNGKEVQNITETPLLPGSTINVVYK